MNQDFYSRAWYHAAVKDFRTTSPDTVLGLLTRNSDFAVDPPQRDAWLAQISALQACLSELSGTIFLEFSIPRMGRRIDAVLLVESVVLVIEFKVGAAEYDKSAIDQVWDYALDLKNFHAASHSAVVVPILVATEAAESRETEAVCAADNVYRPLLTNAITLRETIDQAIHLGSGPAIDNNSWATAPYQPTPTIVEAARVLYASHSVEAIARFDAGAKNLRITSQRIEELVDEASRSGRKIICFVTGVPGAGDLPRDLRTSCYLRMAPGLVES